MAVVSGLDMGESPGSRNKTDDPGGTVISSPGTVQPPVL